MNIEYPSTEQINCEIDKICDRSIHKRVTIRSFLNEMFRNLGMKYVFYGAYDALVISTVISIIVAFLLGRMVLYSDTGETLIYAVAFSAAPLLFMLLFLLSYWKERETALYATKMACKYTVHHLLAFRMLAASFLGFVFATWYVVVLCSFLQIEYVRILSVAYASLFLFSIILIRVVLSQGGSRSVAWVSGLWLIINGIFLTFAGAVYGILLQIIPGVLWIVLDFALAIILIRECGFYVRRVCNAYG